MMFKNVGKGTQQIRYDKTPYKGAQNGYELSNGRSNFRKIRKNKIKHNGSHNNQKGRNAPVKIFLIPLKSFHAFTIHLVFLDFSLLFIKPSVNRLHSFSFNLFTLLIFLTMPQQSNFVTPGNIL